MTSLFCVDGVSFLPKLTLDLLISHVAEITSVCHHARQAFDS
jgi:hypothetical protein